MEHHTISKDEKEHILCKIKENKSYIFNPMEVYIPIGKQILSGNDRHSAYVCRTEAGGFLC